jgi:hypothetical protein
VVAAGANITPSNSAGLVDRQSANSIPCGRRSR